MTAGDKPIRWLATEIKTPPVSREARIEAGVLLRTRGADSDAALATAAVSRETLS